MIGSLTYLPPRKPIPLARICPLTVTVPWASSATIPPERPSHALALMLSPLFFTLKFVYSGTRITWVTVAAYVWMSGAVSVRVEPVTLLMRANSHRPTSDAPRSTGLVCPVVAAGMMPVVCRTITRSSALKASASVARGPFSTPAMEICRSPGASGCVT
ncbi:hypothetical protein DAT35_09340 [Vitiosangium sp. GDMCC 1.1324]|nr:hypothetical protein DAT35_09340 [Vitiosangium sp. GDMCC 1.1324]